MSKNKNIQVMFEREFDAEIMRQKIFEEERKVNMKSNNKFKWVFAPICLIAIVCGVLFFNKDNELKSNINETNSEKKDNIEINIYDISSQGALKFGDEVKIENYDEKVPEWIWNKIMEEFKKVNGISYEDFTNKIPEKFILNNFYTLSLKGYKDAGNKYRTHDYVFDYQIGNNGKIQIALCKEEKPLRDYLFEFKGNKSQIGDTELEISQYKNDYLVNFKYKNMNYDIETTDVTENELTELLLSIIK